jgi:hypothetical protein
VEEKWHADDTDLGGFALVFILIFAILSGVEE